MLKLWRIQAMFNRILKLFFDDFATEIVTFQALPKYEINSTTFLNKPKWRIF